MTPLLEDTYLPGGWSCRGAEESTLSFARDGDRFALEAKRTAEGSAPEFDCPYAWALTYRQRTGVAVVGGSVGFVTTREAAIDGLIACMRRINAALGADFAPDLEATLDGVALHDEVPAAADAHHRSAHSEVSESSDRDPTYHLSDA